MTSRKIQLAAIVLLVTNLLLRGWLLSTPGYVPDTDAYKEWALGTAREGVAAAYDLTSADYPPLFLYMLWTAGKVYLAFHPEAATGEGPTSALLTVLVKTPHLLSDLLLAGLLMLLVTRWRLWGVGWLPETAGAWAGLAYLWNPAVLFGSAYWGQPDSIHSLLAVGALAALLCSSWFTAGCLLGLAVLMKPLAAPLVPLLVLVAAARAGVAGFWRVAAGGGAALVLTFLPFLATGRIVTVAAHILLDLEAMPYTSVNAHNLWWILGSWRPANVAVLGPITPKHIGLVLFLSVYVFLLIASWTRIRDIDREPEVDRYDMFLLWAGVAACFFFLITHMHENHLFLALPLLLAVAGRDRRIAWLALACSAAISINELLHDMVLPYLLPGFLAARAPVTNGHTGDAMTWLQLVGSYANTLIVATVVVGCGSKVWAGRRCTQDCVPRRF